MDDPPFKMMPCLVAVGDYDNVLFLESCADYSSGTTDLQDPSSRNAKSIVHAVTPDEPSKVVPDEFDLGALPAVLQTPDTFVTVFDTKDKSGTSRDKYDIELCHWSPPTLIVALVIGKCTNYQLTNFFTYNHNGSEDPVLIFSGFVLPGGEDVSSELQRVSPLFHLDEHNCTCFSLAEAQLATKHFIDSDLIGRVKARIGSTSFQFPQEHFSEQKYLCNEEIYVSGSFVEVWGLVRVPTHIEG